MKVIYIAGPFRGANSWDMEQNIRRAEELALLCWQSGFATICPHANSRYFQGAADDSIWLDGYLEILNRCDAILLTPDWRKSTGARTEVTYAINHSIPVFETLENLIEWATK